MTRETKLFKGKLTVSEVMSRELVTVPLGTPLVKVAKLLAQCHSRHVLVTDAEGALVGVVSDRDMLRQMVPGQTESVPSWQGKTVESVMVTKLVASSPDANPNDFAALLADGAVECLPILEGNRLVGMLASNDLLLSWNRLRPLLQQAGVDELTGLANRATFNRRLGEELDRARRQQLPLSLVMFDVDHFKQINDTCGHLTGDAILRMVADCLGRQLRTYDVVARLGGDEFAALCCACGPGEIDVPIQRLQHAIKSMSVPLDTGRQRVTLSIGAAVLRNNVSEVTPNQLIHAADACLYQAKNSGRDCFRTTEFGSDDGSVELPSPLRTPHGILAAG